MSTRLSTTKRSIPLGCLALTVLAGLAVLVALNITGTATGGMMGGSEARWNGPGPVYPTGNYIGRKESLSPGDLVLVQRGENWWNAVIVNVVGDNPPLVHFLGWGDELNTVVPHEMLQWPSIYCEEITYSACGLPRMLGLIVDVLVAENAEQPASKLSYRGKIVSLNDDQIVLEDTTYHRLVSLKRADVHAILSVESIISPGTTGSSGSRGR